MQKQINPLVALALAAFFGAGAFVPRAQAALLVYESFDYETGNIAGNNGGTGFTNAWSLPLTGGTAVVDPGSLTFSDLETAGNHLHVTPTSATTGARRSFDTISSGTYYLSSLITLDEGTRFFGISLFNDGVEQVLVGKWGGATVWGLHSAANITGTNANSAVSSTLGQTFLFVLRIDFDASDANERLRLYIDPSLDAEPGTAQVDVITANSITVNAVNFGAGFTAVTHTTTIGSYDEFRLGTTWADVTPVPEPSAFALLGAGLMALVIFGRRKEQTSARAGA